MEDNIHLVVGMIISIYLLFIFPVYMAYEKKDDISYALTLRYTQEFVDNVRNRGYITSTMLDDYKTKLRSTGNSFDVELTHEYTRMDPITNYYTEEGGIYTLAQTTTHEQRLKTEEEYIAIAIENGNLPEYPTEEQKREAIARMYENYVYNGIIYNYAKVEDTYRYSNEVYTTDYIEKVLKTEKKLWLDAMNERFECVDEGENIDSTIKKVTDCQYAYTMNEGDSFNVTIKNTNTTPATLIYNMVTVNTIDNNTRIYVNYGGEILNVQWTGKVDYTQRRDDTLNLFNLNEHLINEGKMIDLSGNAYVSLLEKGISLDTSKGYMLEFEVKPFTVVDLRLEGYTIPTPEMSKYNMAVGDDTFGISVGLNGIALVSNKKVILSYPVTINAFTPIKILVQRSKDVPSQYEVVLYIDNSKVAISIPVGVYGTSSMPATRYIGKAVNRNFSGYIRNVKVHN